MARHQARIVRRARFKSYPFSADEMLSLGNSLRDSVRDRIRLGMDVRDCPAPPLKGPRPSSGTYRSSFYGTYIKTKVDRYGGKPIRDWWRTGRTLRSLQVMTVSPGRVIVGFTDVVSNFRAFINNRRHRQFGISRQDRNNILLKIHQLQGYRGSLLPHVRDAIAGSVAGALALFRKAG